MNLLPERREASALRIPGLISVVAPAYNEEESLPHLYERVRDVMEGLGKDFELIVVENGSTDRSLEILKGLHLKDERVNYLSLSRNFGHQGALIAGLEHSKGDAVISMDADLQHPPELIPEMLRLWEEGYEVVYTIKRENMAQPFSRRLVNRLFYSFLSRVSGLELSGGQSDFRLMDRKAVDALCRMPERNKFLRGLARWIGFRQAGIEYDVPPRFAGESKFRFSHLLRFALDGILSFSIIPLRLFTLFGLVVSGVAFLYGLFIIGSGAYAFFTGYHGRIPPGWATVGAAVFFFGGVQLMGIGLLGEYLGRVYDEAKERPIYLVREDSLQDRGRAVAAGNASEKA
jgi:dolichol-phosphate mannosyltransferase